MQPLVGILFIMSLSISAGDEIQQKESSLSKEEGQSVSLECTFSTTSTYYNIHWYRQYPGTGPQFILFRGYSSYSAEFAKERFSSRAHKASGKASLSISRVQLEDSAVYYCALETPMVEPLTFGSGTALTVLPKDASQKMPTLSILQSMSKEQPHVCLAAGFYPKGQEMKLMEDVGEANKNSKSITVDKAPLDTSSKSYFFAGFMDKGKSLRECELMGQKEQLEEETKPTAQAPSPEECEPASVNDTLSQGRSGDTLEHMKVNFRSLLVHGLRLLLAKVVTFDMMVTVKAMFF